MTRDVLKKKSLRSDLTQRSRTKRRESLYRTVRVWSFVFLGLYVGLGLLSRIPAMAVSSVALSGNRLVSLSEITETVDAELSSSYAFLFSKRNVLIYPRSAIKKRIIREYPRIREVSLSVDSSRVLTIEVSERIGVYVWCGGVPDSGTADSTPCYFLDEKGIVFTEAPYFSGPVYFTFYNDTSKFREGDEMLATTPVEPRIFSSVVHIEETLSLLGVQTDGVVLDGSTVEFLIRSRDALGYQTKILFPMDKDIDMLLDAFSSALRVDPLKTALIEDFVGLEYIDVRFDNRVVYKFR